MRFLCALHGKRNRRCVGGSSCGLHRGSTSVSSSSQKAVRSSMTTCGWCLVWSFGKNLSWSLFCWGIRFVRKRVPGRAVGLRSCRATPCPEGFCWIRGSCCLWCASCAAGCCREAVRPLGLGRCGPVGLDLYPLLFCFLSRREKLYRLLIDNATLSRQTSHKCLHNGLFGGLSVRDEDNA